MLSKRNLLNCNRFVHDTHMLDWQQYRYHSFALENDTQKTIVFRPIGKFFVNATACPAPKCCRWINSKHSSSSTEFFWFFFFSIIKRRLVVDKNSVPNYVWGREKKNGNTIYRKFPYTPHLRLTTAGSRDGEK